MAFRFALAPVLRLRQSLEKQRAQRLQQATLAVVRAREAVAAMESALVDLARSGEQSLRIGQSGAELQFSLIVRRNMLSRQQQLQTGLENLEVERKAAAAEYQRAYREREVLETLATQQHHAYHQEQLQSEQRELDASHLLQLWRKRLG